MTPPTSRSSAASSNARRYPHVTELDDDDPYSTADLGGQPIDSIPPSLTRRLERNQRRAEQHFILAVAAAADDTGVAQISAIEKSLDQRQTSFSQTRLALIERHQLVERTGNRGGLRFVLPEFGSWLRQRGTHRVKGAD